MPNTDEAAIRVVLADDHPGVRFSIRGLLETADDIQVVGEAGTGVEALHQVQIHHPDVLLLDIEMPTLNGIEVARRLQATETAITILVLSTYDDRQFILEMLAAGAAGYLLKEEAQDLLIDAIHSVAQGETGWLSRRLTAQIDRWSKATPAKELLTTLEIDILRLLAQGKTDQEIGTSLSLQEVEVKSQVQVIFAKLQVSSRLGAALWARQHKLFGE